MTEHDALIESVTRPLAKNTKQHAAAIAILEECRVAGHPAEAETLGLLKAVGKRRFAGLWKIACWVLAVLALCGPIVSQLSTLEFTADCVNFPLLESDQPRLPEALTEKERLLFGNPWLAESEQKRRLHLSDPDNPAYFAEYAQAWAREHGGLPRTSGNRAPHRFRQRLFLLLRRRANRW